MWIVSWINDSRPSLTSVCVGHHIYTDLLSLQTTPNVSSVFGVFFLHSFFHHSIQLFQLQPVWGVYVHRSELGYRETVLTVAVGVWHADVECSSNGQGRNQSVRYMCVHVRETQVWVIRHWGEQSGGYLPEKFTPQELFGFVVALCQRRSGRERGGGENV